MALGSSEGKAKVEKPMLVLGISCWGRRWPRGLKPAFVPMTDKLLWCPHAAVVRAFTCNLLLKSCGHMPAPTSTPCTHPAPHIHTLHPTPCIQCPASHTTKPASHLHPASPSSHPWPAPHIPYPTPSSLYPTSRWWPRKDAPALCASQVASPPSSLQLWGHLGEKTAPVTLSQGGYCGPLGFGMMAPTMSPASWPSPSRARAKWTQLQVTASYSSTMSMAAWTRCCRVATSSPCFIRSTLAGPRVRRRWLLLCLATIPVGDVPKAPVGWR